jgi:hypothetical protein
MTPGDDFARIYAEALLKDVGYEGNVADMELQHPALAWAASGCMEVTGRANGPALMCPAPLAGIADGALLALAAMSEITRFDGWRGTALLGQRARLMNLRRQGAISAGGSCRLLPCRDGWLAISLARYDDWDCVPAWLEDPACISWQRIASSLQDQDVDMVLERARLLGLAVARADRAEPPCGWCDGVAAKPIAERRSHAPLVLDLSSLWAGPLCSALLRRAGAHVVKVESLVRPDGARLGHGGFYDFLNSGKASVALDFQADPGRAQLRNLMLRADIVIASSRPRALRQIGINAAEIMAENPGVTWVSITGHGGNPPASEWIGFGDDSAAAGGLCAAMQAAHGEMVFCGDAIADPLTGMHAAVAAWAGWLQGGGRKINLSLRGVVAHCVAVGASDDPARRSRKWTALVAQNQPATLPLPKAESAARAFGADTRAVLADIGMSSGAVQPTPYHC